MAEQNFALIDHFCFWRKFDCQRGMIPLIMFVCGEFMNFNKKLVDLVVSNHLRDSIDHGCNLWCVSQIFRHKRSLNHRFSWGNPNSCQMGTSEFRILSLTCIIFLTLLRQFKKTVIFIFEINLPTCVDRTVVRVL